jgi:hypothetical protein
MLLDRFRLPFWSGGRSNLDQAADCLWVEKRRRSSSGAASVAVPLITQIGFVWVRLEGACHQRRRIPPRELSIDLVADERLGRATGRAEAS